MRSSRPRGTQRLRNSLVHGKMSSSPIEPPTLPRPSPARAQELSRKARSAHGGSQKLGAAIAVAKFEHKLHEVADAIGAAAPAPSPTSPKQTPSSTDPIPALREISVQPQAALPVAAAPPDATPPDATGSLGRWLRDLPACCHAVLLLAALQLALLAALGVIVLATGDASGAARLCAIALLLTSTWAFALGVAGVVLEHLEVQAAAVALAALASAACVLLRSAAASCRSASSSSLASARAPSCFLLEAAICSAAAALSAPTAFFTAAASASAASNCCLRLSTSARACFRSASLFSSRPTTEA